MVFSSIDSKVRILNSHILQKTVNDIWYSSGKHIFDDDQLFYNSIITAVLEVCDYIDRLKSCTIERAILLANKFYYFLRMELSSQIIR